MALRKAHRLKGNKGSEYPNAMIFFDTETRPVQVDSKTVRHELVLGTAIFWQRRHGKTNDTVEYFSFRTKEEILDFINRHVYERRRTYLVSHNLDFDMAVCSLYDGIRGRGFSLKSFWESPPARFMKFVNGRRTLVCIDNGNYFRGSLEEIGKDIGFEKLHVDFDKCTLEELAEYNKRDTEILYYLWKRWIEFCENNDLGAFGPTLAAQSFNAFRHRFMQHNIFIHDHENVLKLEREAYYGGRIECLHVGPVAEDPVYCLDINSMYPYVMREHDYPTKLVAYKKDVGVEFLQHYIKKFAVVAKVDLNTEEACFPSRLDKHTFYFTGQFTSTLTTPEIRYALERGWITKVHEVALYEKAPIFREFVDFFYTERLKAKDAGEKMFSYFYKILMNSLYGKFGQKGIAWETVGEVMTDKIDVYKVWDPVKKKWIRYRQHNGIVEVAQERGEAFNSFPAISAHVTAYARMYLWQLMNEAGLENVFYVDTDSLFVNEAGKERLRMYVDNRKLGMLKLERVMHELVIYAPKDYAWSEGKKIKGVRKTAKQVGVNVYQQERWNNFATRLRQGNINEYTVTMQEKHLKRQYHKGFVTSSGRVEWWTLPEDEEIVYSYIYGEYNPVLSGEVRKALLNDDKRIRKLVIKLGGVNDRDYEDIPRWAKRKRGRTLDEFVAPLQSEGVQVYSAEDVYNLLKAVSPSPS